MLNFIFDTILFSVSYTHSSGRKCMVYIKHKLYTSPQSTTTVMDILIDVVWSPGRLCVCIVA